MHTNHSSSYCGAPGFTLSEVLISSLIASMMLVVMLTFYIMGIKFLKTGITLTFYQQAHTAAIEQLVELIRPATRIGIRNNVTSFPSPYPTPASFFWPNVVTATNYIANTSTNYSGNCIVIVDQFAKLTSMVCQIGNTLYYLPNASAGTPALTNRCRIIATNLRPQTNTFSIIKNSIFVRMTFVDSVDTNKVIITTRSVIGTNVSEGILMSPRNIRGLL